MNKNVKLPDWIAKQSVPETKHHTIELYNALAEFAGEEKLDINPDELTDKDFVEYIVGKGNICIKKLLDEDPKCMETDSSPWVGFPETMVGRLNSMLVGTIWRLREHEDGMEKQKPSNVKVNTGFA